MHLRASMVIVKTNGRRLVIFLLLAFAEQLHGANGTTQALKGADYAKNNAHPQNPAAPTLVIPEPDSQKIKSSQGEGNAKTKLP